MLDIFDEMSMKNEKSMKDQFSIEEEVDAEKQMMTEDPFNLNEGFQTNNGNMADIFQQRDSGLLLSRKGSGDQAHLMDSSFSLQNPKQNKSSLGNAPCFSNHQIGVELTPNLEIGKNLRRRSTRESESLLKRTSPEVLRAHLIGESNSEFSEDLITEDIPTLSKLERRGSRVGKRKRASRTKQLVTEDTYTEQFNYKKFIEAELSKIGIFVARF